MVELSKYNLKLSNNAYNRCNGLLLKIDKYRIKRDGGVPTFIDIYSFIDGYSMLVHVYHSVN